MTGLPRGPELPGYPVQAQNPPLLSTQAKGVNQAEEIFSFGSCAGESELLGKEAGTWKEHFGALRGEARELSAPHGNRNTFFLETVSS